MNYIQRVNASDQFADSLKLTVCTLENDTVELELSKKAVIYILASENTCSRCYETLENYLNLQKNKYNFKIIVIARMPDCIFCKREFMKKYHLFKLADKFYFDNAKHNNTFYTDKYEDGLWGRFYLKQTPASIFYFDNKIEVFTFEEMFDDLALSEKFKSFFSQWLSSFY